MLHLDEDHLHPVAPRPIADPRGRRDRFLNHADVDSGAIEHPAFRAEVVLHVDHDHAGAREIDRERLGPRGNRHQPDIVGHRKPRSLMLVMLLRLTSAD
jgi:hypothetical protein